MPSTYTGNLGIELPADGELDGVWGDVVNENMGILDRAINGSLALALSGISSTLTTSDGSLSDGQYKLLVLGGSPSGTHTITIAPSNAQKIYFVRNTTAQSVVFTQGSGGNVTVATGDSAIIYSDGAGATAAVVNITNEFAMNSVKITGGTIDGTVIGGSSAAAGTFTTAAISGVASFADGTALLPSIANTGDTNTGLFFPAEDNLGLGTGGTERMRIDASGNVGIGGTASGLSRLHLFASDVNRMFGISGTTNGLRFGTTSTTADIDAVDTTLVAVYKPLKLGGNEFRFSVNDIEYMRMISSGNLGLGTTSPTFNLQVALPDATTNKSMGLTETSYATNFRATYLTQYGVSATGTSFGISNANLGILTFQNLSAGLIATNGTAPLVFATTGLERMRIDASGNVGIGISGPSCKVEVNGTIRSTTLVPAFEMWETDGTTDNKRWQISADVGVMYIRALNDAGGGGGAYLIFTRVGNSLQTMQGYRSGTLRSELSHWDSFLLFSNAIGNIGTATAHDFLLKTSNTERMRIDTSGNVGIGVTPSAWVSTSKAVQLSGISLESTSATSGNFFANAYRDSAYVRRYVNTGTANQFDMSVSGFRWFNAPSGTAGDAVTFTQHMTLDASGNLGIGTTGPAEKLDVVGKGVFTSNNDILTLKYASDVGSARLAWKNVAGTTLWDIVGGMVVQQDELAIRRQGTTVAYFNSSGNVGIGNSAPVTKLHVTGASITTGVVYKAQAAQTSKAAAATLTIAELLTGIIQYTGVAATLTLPTGTSIEGGLPATFPTDMSFDVSFINTGAALLTIGANGNTTVGTMTVATLTSAMLRFRKTAANTYTVYRIS